MEIVHIITSLGTGGAERLVVDLAAEARTRGNSVRIVTLGESAGLPAASAQRMGLEVVSLRTNPRDPRAFVGLRSAIGTPDISHAHLFPTQYAAALLPGPKIFTEHSTQNRRMNRPGWKRLERWSYSRYDEVVAISEGVADALVAHLGSSYAQRPTVIPNGVRNEFFSNELPARQADNHLRLVAIGSLRPVKNFALAIDALSRFPAATLDIIGEGPLRRDLDEKIAGMGLSDRVRLLGVVDNLPDELPDYDALISTSKYEGFALVAAEAMASGLPVVGPDIPGFNNVVKGGKFACLYDPTLGSTDIVRALGVVQQVLEDSSTRSSARKHAEQFSLASCYDRYEEIYHRVLRL